MIPKIERSVMAALRARLQTRQNDVLALTRALVEHESPSGDWEGSRLVVGLLAESAQRIEGVGSVERIIESEYGEHLRVCAFRNAAVGEESILLLGHTDTVYPRGSIAARPWREDAGRIYAPGIFDMKINCALAVEALRVCAELQVMPKRQVVLLLTCDEEAGSEGGRRLVEEEAKRAEAVLVLEPPASGGRVKTARKGTGIFTMKVEGIAAHAGLEPERGASAILEIARQIERLHRMNDPAVGTTVNVGVVQGGTRSNVVAAEAAAEIDVRFSTMTEAKRIEREIRESTPFDSRVRLSVDGHINRPPLERTPAVAELYDHARHIALLLDFELGEASVGGASDGNFAAAIGATVLDGLGVSGDGAHAVHEHILVDDISRRGALLAGLIATL